MTSTVLSTGDKTVDEIEEVSGAHILVVGGQIMRSACTSFCYKEKKGKKKKKKTGQRPSSAVTVRDQG